jgi:dTMP kinase
MNEPQTKAGDGAARPRGKLITLEGGEGAGKSTQIGHLLRRLGAAGIEAIATREPGGSEGAEILRKILLSGVVKPLGPAAEAILFAAARIDHIDNTIEPALRAGKWVVSDRFSDSTRAYQGGAGEIDPRVLNALERVALGDLRPDLTLILDLPAEEGLRRAARRRAPGETLDRFEGEDLRFHQSLRASFLAIAAADAGRCAVIDAGAPEAEVADAIWRVASARLIAAPAEQEHGA